MTTISDYFDGLDELPPAAAPAANTQKFPCDLCAGTGKWLRGRNSNGETKCFACRGTGHFKTSSSHRSKARQNRRSLQERKLSEAQAEFSSEHGDLIKTLRSYVDWNEFAQSLVDQFEQRGSLTDKQIAAAERMVAKTEASRAARAKAQAEGSVKVDLAAIREMFEKVNALGYRKPSYRAEGLAITRAPDSGRNPGALYVKADGDYVGKILDTTFQPVRGADDAVQAALEKIAVDPEAAAVSYGRKHGRCACCGRGLTNQVSIDMGIGPICRDNWF